MCSYVTDTCVRMLQDTFYLTLQDTLDSTFLDTWILMLHVGFHVPKYVWHHVSSHVGSYFLRHVCSHVSRHLCSHSRHVRFKDSWVFMFQDMDSCHKTRGTYRLHGYLCFKTSLLTCSRWFLFFQVIRFTLCITIQIFISYLCISYISYCIYT